MKRKGPGKFSDRRGMRYEAGIRMPLMQLVARWLHHKPRRRINREIERYLVRGAG